ncbi:Metal-dependent hydrolase [Halapricum desulfuricans]|uniref:Metal-dependent hydrolase n=1 Tax=Halapricum desulfuricans TaxID=2841257 RepID=A0A897NKF2_9EURY|nr:endonuclease/exonuclease/phosphatase family protein [Halapricum desulfuricans]QSG12781.1 Metal-dependent hydrolase [Halapricum desulfuricans]
MTAWFRVMTYNVRYDNPDDGEHRWSNRREGVADTIRFREPSLLGLQEPLEHQLSYLREQLPGYEWAGDPRVDGDSEGEYSPVAFDGRRFDLVETDTFWLSETPERAGSLGWDARHPRIVTWVRLRDRDTGAVFVHANTHFSHDGPQARRHSARLLRERLDELTDDEPVIVTGDFNCIAGESPHETIVDPDAGRRALSNAIDRSEHGHYGPETSVTDFEHLVPNRKIDHVFVTDDVEVRQHGVCTDLFAAERYPSDHFPVLAQVRLE